MPTKRCCCQAGGCIIDSDDFGRADSASLGAKWEDPDSAWSIDSGEALSVGAGVAIFDVNHPTPDESMQAFLTTIDEVEGSGRKYRVLVNVLDEDNYHFAEFQRFGANDSWMRIGIVSGGTETILKQEEIVGLTGTTRQIIAKIAYNEFCGVASNCVLSIVSADPSLFANGIRSGIQAMDAGTRIDDFNFGHHMYTRDECANCLCLCESWYIPPVLNANLTGTGRLAGLNVDLTLVWDRLNGNFKTDPPVVACGSPGQTWAVRFFCPDDITDGSTAGLSVESGCNNSDGFGTARRDPDSYTCNPLEYVFGPYNVSILDLACGCGPPFVDSGTYTIVITEA